jgi:hypothetical protein
MKLILNTIILIFLTNACGFKIVNLSDLNNYYISSVETKGDKKANYIIKNNLLNSFRDENKISLNLNLETKKVRDIKEKNIKNEITKYEVTIETLVIFEQTNKNKKKRIIISKSGEYGVNEQYSQTITNEKNLIKVLSNEVSEEILLKLAEALDDL